MTLQRLQAPGPASTAAPTLAPLVWVGPLQQHWIQYQEQMPLPQAPSLSFIFLFCTMGMVKASRGGSQIHRCKEPVGQCTDSPWHTVLAAVASTF